MLVKLLFTEYSFFLDQSTLDTSVSCNVVGPYHLQTDRFPVLGNIVSSIKKKKKKKNLCIIYYQKKKKKIPIKKIYIWCIIKFITYSYWSLK